jgi:hypothetical protein
VYFTDDPPERIPSMLRLGRQNIDIASETKNYTVTDSFVLPVDVVVQAVQPHAHNRAREITGSATLPDGTVQPLIDIKDWDFRWQHVYRYVQPFALPKGTPLSMRFTYDNSSDNPRNPDRPARRVCWGQRSSDEMGDLWIQVITGNDPAALDVLAAAYASAGDFDRATEVAQSALSLNPENAKQIAARRDLYRSRLPYRLR